MHSQMVMYAIGRKISRIKKTGSSLMSLCMNALWIHVPLCVCVCVCVCVYVCYMEGRWLFHTGSQNDKMTIR